MSFYGSLKWIDTNGGPLLLLEESLLSKWRGVHVKNSQVLESDYDRAYAFEDYVGLVIVGTGYGLVLDDEPFMTTWLTIEKQNGLLVRWVYAESEQSVITALTDLQVEKWENTELEIRFSGYKLALFDAACEGADLPYKIELPRGNYRIETSHYKPDEETYLILHRFI